MIPQIIALPTFYVWIKRVNFTHNDIIYIYPTERMRKTELRLYLLTFWNISHKLFLYHGQMDLWPD